MVLEICGRERPIRVARLLVGAAEVVEQLLVYGRLLERVELAAVQVLEQGVPEQVVVVGVLDDRRNGVLAGQLAGPETTLAHDELEARRGGLVRLGDDRPDDDRLQDADLADRGVPARRARPRRRRSGLARVRADRLDRQDREGGSGNGARARFRRRRRRSLSTGIP